MTEPCASSTARETMFSEAMSSIESRCRPSSSSIARAISGSASASGAEKNEFERTDTGAETFIGEPSMNRGLARRASAALARRPRLQKGDRGAAPQEGRRRRKGSAAVPGAGENDDLVLGDAIQEAVGLFVQEIPVDAFRLEAGDAQFPAGAFILQRGEFRLERNSVGVEFDFGLEPVLAVRGAPHEVAAGDPQHEVEDDRRHDLAQARPYDHPPILRGTALKRS